MTGMWRSLRAASGQRLNALHGNASHAGGSANVIPRSADSGRPGLACALFAAFVLLPLLALAIGEPFVLVIATRIMIFAIAALSLDLILGYGGMVSFGHAAFIGIGA